MSTASAAGDLRERAQALIEQMAGAEAVLRDDQLTAIEALVRDHRRVLLVQRTGWGKSAVYFAATRLLRDAGGGPTLLVSPLLALMRDQIAAAERIRLPPAADADRTAAGAGAGPGDDGHRQRPGHRRRCGPAGHRSGHAPRNA